MNDDTGNTTGANFPHSQGDGDGVYSFDEFNAEIAQVVADLRKRLTRFVSDVDWGPVIKTFSQVAQTMADALQESMSDAERQRLQQWHDCKRDIRSKRRAMLKDKGRTYRL